MRVIKRTPEAISYARLLHGQGLNFSEIGRRLGIDGKTAHAWVNPEFDAALRNANKLHQRKHSLQYVAPTKVPADTRPTLAHVPGVEIHGRYSTIPFRTAQRLTPHGALKKPRSLFAMPCRDTRIVHLGGGKIWQEEMRPGKHEVPFQ